jgi:hypothetical protein
LVILILVFVIFFVIHVMVRLELQSMISFLLVLDFKTNYH